MSVAPDTPRNVSVTEETPTSVTLTATSPVKTGGMPITHWTVKYEKVEDGSTEATQNFKYGEFELKRRSLMQDRT